MLTKIKKSGKFRLDILFFADDMSFGIGRTSGDFDELTFTNKKVIIKWETVKLLKCYILYYRLSFSLDSDAIVYCLYLLRKILHFKT